MSKLFYLSEIVKFAIQKEQESFDLYQKLAQQVSNIEVRAIFEVLASEEVKHKDFYNHMLANVKNEQTPGVKEDEEYQAYMETLISDSRYIPALTADDFKNIPKVLDYAIAREKDSVLFYSSLKNFIPASAYADIDKIIHEEERHASILLRVKEKCASTNL